MEKKSLQFMKVVSFCGACIAFYIGAGFATMQEIIQYVASYGSKLWIVIAVNAAIYIYTDLSFATNGNRLKLKRGGDIYTHYCGKYIGNFFDYFSALFCYACFIVMCGGANATAAQQWGLPNGVGAVILTVFVIATVIFGLDGVIEALGKIGPIIVFFILVVSVISIFNGAGNFWENLKAVGSFSTKAYENFRDPILVERIQADAGLDIGDTFIGMHLKSVAVPLRLSQKELLHAHVTAARVRPKFIGGIRASYDERLL